jgi:hypothetical protein
MYFASMLGNILPGRLVCIVHHAIVRSDVTLYRAR